MRNRIALRRKQCVPAVHLQRGTPSSILPGFEDVTFVYLMGENQSYLRMHGVLNQVWPELDGIDPQQPHCNEAPDGTRYYQQPLSERLPMFGPEHSMADTAQQMSHRALGDMGGFVWNFKENYPDARPQDLQDIMGYFPLGTLPFSHTIARYCKVFGHWHADVPGPTWPNRMFPFCGQSGQRVNMTPGLAHRNEWLQMDLPIIFDQLNEAGVTWAYFAGDIPLAITMKRFRHAANASHLHPMRDFYRIMAGPRESIPRVIIIEPTWEKPLNPEGTKPNSDLWPADPLDGQMLLKNVYEALRRSTVWEHTVFIATKDEHGGYFDSEFPPFAVPTGVPGPNGEYAFNQLGLRVPTLAISPLIEAGADNGVYSSVSFTRTLSDVYGLPYLTDRVAAANSLVPMITRLDNPRTDFPMEVEVSEADMLPVGQAAQAKASDSFMGDFGHELTAAVESAAILDAPGLYAGAMRMVQRARQLRLRLRHRKLAGREAQLARYHLAAKQVEQHAERARRKAA